MAHTQQRQPALTTSALAEQDFGNITPSLHAMNKEWLWFRTPQALLHAASGVAKPTTCLARQKSNTAATQQHRPPPVLS
eukprot:scaffold195242_cov19-Tisochrysis_lutea.AAC.1